MFKRVALFLATNLAIILVISLILSIFNVQPYLSQYGLNYQSLLIYVLIIGFTGPNAFATSWNKNKALVAVPTGLL